MGAFLKSFKKNLFFLSFSVLLISCSSDSDGGDVDEKFNAVGTFEIVFDGVQTEMKALSSSRYGDKFIIYGDLQNGYYFQMEFHKSGALGHIYIDTQLDNTIFSQYYTTQNFSSNYTSFNLISVNESNNKIKGNFSGKLFNNSENLPIGDFKEVTGNFEITYGDFEELWGDKFDCKINNTNWYRSSRGNVQIGSNIYEEFYYSDDAYRFRYTFKGTNTSNGTYSFNSENDINSIRLEKFNTETNTYLYYNCEGEITFSNIQNLNNGANEVTYDATFHLTATNPENPSDVVQVTNGNAQGAFYFD